MNESPRKRDDIREGYTEKANRFEKYAQMVELVYTEVSKSSFVRIAGSSPALGTKLNTHTSLDLNLNRARELTYVRSLR